MDSFLVVITELEYFVLKEIYFCFNSVILLSESFSLELCQFAVVDVEVLETVPGSQENVGRDPGQVRPHHPEVFDPRGLPGDRGEEGRGELHREAAVVALQAGQTPHPQQLRHVAHTQLSEVLSGHL